MILDNAKKLIVENSRSRPVNTRLRVNVSQSLLEDDSIFGGEWEEIYGFNELSWQPREEPRYKERGDYVLASSILKKSHGTIRVRSYADLLEKAKRDKRLQFLVDWSTIEERTFGVARRNKGVRIPLGIKVEDYEEYLMEKWKERYGEYPPPDYPLMSNPVINEISVKSRQAYRSGMIQNGKNEQLYRQKTFGYDKTSSRGEENR